MFVKSYRGGEGPEWDHVIIVEQKKENYKVQCMYRKSLAVQTCVTSLALRPRKLPGLIQITDYIPYINNWICYFYCKERVGLNWGGGCCPLQF